MTDNEVISESGLLEIMNAQPFAETRNDATRVWQLFGERVHVGDAIKAILSLAGFNELREYRAAAGMFAIEKAEQRRIAESLKAENEALQQQLAAIKEQLSGMDELMKFSESEETAVWDYLQKHSPWSPSNDMNWSDEIICGIDGLLQQLSAANSLLDQRFEELAAAREANAALIECASRVGARDWSHMGSDSFRDMELLREAIATLQRDSQP